MNAIQDLWRFSEMAYNYNQNDPLLRRAMVNIPLKNSIDFAFISEFSDRLIISFRGTSGSIETWLSDFYSTLCKDTDFGKVHSGFHAGWEAFENSIHGYIRGTVEPDKPIFITGHSRGGALATLCALHLARHFNNPISNINFASPAVGMRDFRDKYEHSSIFTTRVVNGYDIIPTLPFYDMGFRHVGRKTHLVQPWWHKWFCRISDHYRENYKVAIDLYKTY